MSMPKIMITKAEIPSILFHIDKLITQGMNIAALRVAVNIQIVAREYLSKGIKAYGGKEGGKLSEAILVKPADTKNIRYSRWDVIVDTGRAPYALWIEFGRNAIDGLPYSRVGGRDYSQSSFPGYRYMTKALRKYSGKEGIDLAATAIIESLQGKDAFKGLKK